MPNGGKRLFGITAQKTKENKVGTLSESSPLFPKPKQETRAGLFGQILTNVMSNNQNGGEQLNKSARLFGASTPNFRKSSTTNFFDNGHKSMIYDGQQNEAKHNTSSTLLQQMGEKDPLGIKNGMLNKSRLSENLNDSDIEKMRKDAEELEKQRKGVDTIRSIYPPLGAVSAGVDNLRQSPNEKSLVNDLQFHRDTEADHEEQERFIQK